MVVFASISCGKLFQVFFQWGDHLPLLLIIELAYVVLGNLVRSGRLYAAAAAARGVGLGQLVGMLR